MRTRILFAATFALGACSTPSTYVGTTIPPLSVIGDANDAMPAKTGACENGWRADALGRKGENMQSAYGSGGWIYVYPVGDATATKYFALRSVSAARPTVAQSIAWTHVVGSYQLIAAPDGTPTVFYLEPAPLATFTIRRARLVGGAWQIDAQPVWSGEAGESAAAGNGPAFFAAFGPDGKAQVLIDNSLARLVAVEDGKGGWSARNTGLVPNANDWASVQWFGVDAGGGHHAVIIADEDFALAEDGGGAWAITVKAFGVAGPLVLDAAGHLHQLGIDVDGSNTSSAALLDHHETAPGVFVDDQISVPSLPLGSFPNAVVFDGNGAYHVAGMMPPTALGAPNPVTAGFYATNAGGAWTMRSLPDSQQQTLALDGNGNPTFAAVSITTAPPVNNVYPAPVYQPLALTTCN
jgi:hypothetical protein